MGGQPQPGGLHLRMMNRDDLGHIPVGCQGTTGELGERLDDLGSAAVLAFDGDRHVGQLQFRRYDQLTRSPSGIWDPLYWGDFGETAPVLPSQTLCVHCFHVGQVDESDYRDGRYQGRQIGVQLLRKLLTWATEERFRAVIAKGAPPVAAVAAFMGGLPRDRYVKEGFEIVGGAIDPELGAALRSQRLAADGDPDEAIAQLSWCVRYL